ncbi:MAG: hypothetical protein GX929_00620 [Clostridiales bacterium]|nr:hypothetical protein [Clostridiales bacterium]
MKKRGLKDALKRTVALALVFMTVFGGLFSLPGMISTARAADGKEIVSDVDSTTETKPNIAEDFVYYYRDIKKRALGTISGVINADADFVDIVRDTKSAGALVYKGPLANGQLDMLNSEFTFSTTITMLNGGRPRERGMAFAFHNDPRGESAIGGPGAANGIHGESYYAPTDGSWFYHDHLRNAIAVEVDPQRNAGKTAGGDGVLVFQSQYDLTCYDNQAELGNLWQHRPGVFDETVDGHVAIVTPAPEGTDVVHEAITRVVGMLSGRCAKPPAFYEAAYPPRPAAITIRWCITGTAPNRRYTLQYDYWRDASRIGLADEEKLTGISREYTEEEVQAMFGGTGKAWFGVYAGSHPCIDRWESINVGFDSYRKCEVNYYYYKKTIAATGEVSYYVRVPENIMGTQAFYSMNGIKEYQLRDLPEEMLSYKNPIANPTDPVITPRLNPGSNVEGMNHEKPHSFTGTIGNDNRVSLYVVPFKRGATAADKNVVHRYGVEVIPKTVTVIADHILKDGDTEVLLKRQLISDVPLGSDVGIALADTKKICGYDFQEVETANGVRRLLAFDDTDYVAAKTVEFSTLLDGSVSNPSFRIFYQMKPELRDAKAAVETAINTIDAAIKDLFIKNDNAAVESAVGPSIDAAQDAITDLYNALPGADKSAADKLQAVIDAANAVIDAWKAGNTAVDSGTIGTPDVMAALEQLKGEIETIEGNTAGGNAYKDILEDIRLAAKFKLEHAPILKKAKYNEAIGEGDYPAILDAYWHHGFPAGSKVRDYLVKEKADLEDMIAAIGALKEAALIQAVMNVSALSMPDAVDDAKGIWRDWEADLRAGNSPLFTNPDEADTVIAENNDLLKAIEAAEALSAFYDPITGNVTETAIENAQALIDLVTGAIPKNEARADANRGALQAQLDEIEAEYYAGKWRAENPIAARAVDSVNEDDRGAIKEAIINYNTLLSEVRNDLTDKVIAKLSEERKKLSDMLAALDEAQRLAVALKEAQDAVYDASHDVTLYDTALGKWDALTQEQQDANPDLKRAIDAAQKIRDGSADAQTYIDLVEDPINEAALQAQLDTKNAEARANQWETDHQDIIAKAQNMIVGEDGKAAVLAAIDEFNSLPPQVREILGKRENHPSNESDITMLRRSRNFLETYEAVKKVCQGAASDDIAAENLITAVGLWDQLTETQHIVNSYMGHAIDAGRAILEASKKGSLTNYDEIKALIDEVAEENEPYKTKADGFRALLEQQLEKLKRWIAITDYYAAHPPRGPSATRGEDDAEEEPKYYDAGAEPGPYDAWVNPKPSDAGKDLKPHSAGKDYKPYDRDSASLKPVYPKNASEKEKAYIDKMFLMKGKDLASYVNIPYTELPKATIDYKDAYIKGFEDETFRGTAPLTRIQLVTIFSRILKRTDADMVPVNYKDMKDDKHWGKTYLARLESMHLFEGYPDGEFKPDRPMTRAEFAKTIVTFWDIRGYKADRSGTKFSDMGQHWAREYANAMYNTGLMSGYADGKFYPDRPITRSEVVIIINKLLNRAPAFPEVPSLKDLAQTCWYYGAAEAAMIKAKGTLWD